ncbi:MAG: response regulator transcription factor [Bryobacterales bacterium]|nr:response regulator transcription factor [Bryobacterales bacterium]
MTERAFAPSGSPADAVSTPSALTVLIVDDEELARDELSYLLREFQDIEIVGFAANGPEALEAIEDLEPDIVFLDVQMPGLDGLSVIRRLREQGIPAPYFVLSTAYDQYAVEAFREEAFDYLLKPIEKERLSVTIDRARRHLADRARMHMPVASDAGQRSGNQPRPKILVKSNSRNLIVDPSEIIFATIEDGLITLVCTQVAGLSNYRTIEELQSALDPDIFWRVHRSYLVNINRIRELVPWFKSSFQLKMDDKAQTCVPVSRVQTKRLRSLLKL